MPGPRKPQGPRPKIENPGKLFMRLMRYILTQYKWHVIAVVILILSLIHISEPTRH